MRILPLSLLAFLNLSISCLSPIYGSEEERIYIDKEKKFALSEVGTRVKHEIRKTIDEVTASLSLSPSAPKKKRVRENASFRDEVSFPSSFSSWPPPISLQGGFPKNILLTKLATLDERYSDFLISKKDKSAFRVLFQSKTSPLLKMIPQDMFINISEYIHDFTTLTSLRVSCRDLYFNPGLIKWSYARLYRQGTPKSLTLPLYRVITCISRSLARPTLLPDEHELSFIDTELRKDSRFNVAVAFIPGVKGDERATYRALKTLATYGDQDAQRIVIDALYRGRFGEEERLEAERFKDLRAIAMSGSSKAHQHAQKIVIDALYEGEFGQEERSEEDRFKDLTLLAKNGNSEGHQYAQKRLIDAIYEGYIGQEKRPEIERIEELRSITTRIDVPEATRQHARKRIIDAIYEGRYGQGERPEIERIKELRSMAAVGASEEHQHARKRISDAIYYGCLGQAERPEAERFKELKVIAASGSSEEHQHAQKLINMTLAHGHLGQQERPKTEILDELRRIAAAGTLEGHQDAQVYINEALWHGRFDQDKRPPGERFRELKTMAAVGSFERHQHAQRLVNMALMYGFAGQEILPEPVRFRELRIMAATGSFEKNQNAQMLIVNAIKNREFGYEIHMDVESISKKVSFMYEILKEALNKLAE